MYALNNGRHGSFVYALSDGAPPQGHYMLQKSIRLWVPWTIETFYLEKKVVSGFLEVTGQITLFPLSFVFVLFLKALVQLFFHSVLFFSVQLCLVKWIWFVYYLQIVFLTIQVCSKFCNDWNIKIFDISYKCWKCQTLYWRNVPILF